MDSKKKSFNIDAAELDLLSFFIPYVSVRCQGLAAYITTLQLDRQQFGRRFGCVMLVAANVAFSC